MDADPRSREHRPWTTNTARPTIPSVTIASPTGHQRGSEVPPTKLPLDLGNGVKLEMVLIPAGEFLMGSPDSDRTPPSDEKPQHRVRITKPFYLGKYLVTQEQWEAVMGNNPSHFKGPKNPVEKVSWDDCQQFLRQAEREVGGRRQVPVAHRSPVGICLPRGEHDEILLRGR